MHSLSIPDLWLVGFICQTSDNIWTRELFPLSQQTNSKTWPDVVRCKFGCTINPNINWTGTVTIPQTIKNNSYRQADYHNCVYGNWKLDNYTSTNKLTTWWSTSRNRSTSTSHGQMGPNKWIVIYIPFLRSCIGLTWSTEHLKAPHSQSFQK